MPYTYQRSSDGCDETFDIMTPEGEHLVSVHFWGEAEEAEGRAKLIVKALNSPALELLRAVLPYDENEAFSLEDHKDSPEAEAGAERAPKLVEAAQAFLENRGAGLESRIRS